MRTFGSIQEFAAAEGEELGVSDWSVVEQDRIDLFADATDDHQWIHVDPVRSADGPFGRTIAHGFLTLSLVPKFHHQIYEVNGVRMAVNYGLDKVRFITPVGEGDRVRGRAVLDAVAPLEGAVQGVVTTTIEIDGQERPAASVTSIVRYFA